MVEATKAIYTNYANFNGRTSRRDFWLGYLGILILSFVVGFVGGIIDGLTGAGIGSVAVGLFSLASFIPLLAVEVRRLHDVNKSGWYLLMSLIPLVGGILVLIQLCTASVDANNQYN